MTRPTLEVAVTTMLEVAPDEEKFATTFEVAPYEYEEGYSVQGFNGTNER